MTLIDTTNYQEVKKLVIEAARKGRTDIIYPDDKLTEDLKEVLKSEGFVIMEDLGNTQLIMW